MFVDLYITHKTHSFSPPAGEMVTERISERIWTNHFGERTENERISWKNQSFHHYGVRTLALRVLSRCVSVRSWIHSAVCSPVHVSCGVHAVRVFIGCMHSCYVLCCVARSLCFSLAACYHVVMFCVNMWHMNFLISCVFVSCFAHGWWFLFCWPCACVFVLCEHMAFVLVFCVPCALISIVLTSPTLLPDYWLICPTCLPSLPSSFAPFIISLCLQFCASSSYVPLPWRPVPSFPYGVVFVINKIPSPAPLSPCLIPSPQP